MSRTICSVVTAVLAVLLAVVFHVGRQIDNLSVAAADLGRPIPEVAACFGSGELTDIDLRRLLMATRGSTSTLDLADSVAIADAAEAVPTEIRSLTLEQLSAQLNIRFLAPAELDSVLSLDVLPASSDHRPEYPQDRRPI